jgi:hypothetical protein
MVVAWREATEVEESLSRHSAMGVSGRDDYPGIIGTWLESLVAQNPHKLQDAVHNAIHEVEADVTKLIQKAKASWRLDAQRQCIEY